MVRRALRWYLMWNVAVLAVVVAGVVVLSWVMARNEAVRGAEVTAHQLDRTPAPVREGAHLSLWEFAPPCSRRWRALPLDEGRRDIAGKALPAA